MPEFISNPEEGDEDTQKGRYLLFSLDRETYGLEIRNVIEIIGLQAITGIPELPAYIKGIINIRGKIIPVMDVSLRFQKEQREYNDRTCVVVIQLNELCIGLVVDCVTDVVAIHEKDIVEPPSFNKGIDNRYINSIGKLDDKIVLILDCNKLLWENKQEAPASVLT